jgi:uncharacterized membrane protein YkoI
MAYRKILLTSMAMAVALGVAGGAIAETGKSVSPPAVKAGVPAQPSLVTAIAAAQRHTAGRALKVRTDHDKGPLAYRVTVVASGKLLKVYVAASDGKVIRVEDEGRLDRSFDRDDRSEIAKFLSAPTTLSAAIKTAVANGEKAIRAAFENDDGKVLIEVKVAKGDHVRSVKVNGATGKVVNAGDRDRETDSEHTDED